MINNKKREKTTILSFAGEGEKEITWNSVINPEKKVVAVCSFYTDLSQMLVKGLTKKKELFTTTPSTDTCRGGKNQLFDLFSQPPV